MKVATATQQRQAAPLSRATAPDLFRLTRQGALTVKVTIESGQEARLAALLATINAGVGKGVPIPFGDLKTVHFMRWVILPANAAKNIPASLVLSSVDPKLTFLKFIDERELPGDFVATPLRYID